MKKIILLCLLLSGCKPEYKSANDDAAVSAEYKSFHDQHGHESRIFKITNMHHNSICILDQFFESAVSVDCAFYESL